MKFVLSFLLITLTYSNLRQNEAQSNDFIKCLASVNKIISKSAELINEFKKTEKDVEKIIVLSSDIIQLIPEFTNNCVAPGSFPWNIKPCVADLESFALTTDKLVLAIKSKDIGEIVSNVMSLVLSIPTITQDCANWTFPIDVGQCMGDFFNVAYHAQAAIEMIKNPPIDPKLLIPQITQVLEGIEPLAKDCLKYSLPFDLNPCIEEISFISIDIFELIQELKAKPIVISKVISTIKKILDKVPETAEKCYPKVEPLEPCMKDINLIIDDLEEIVQELIKPEINWPIVISKIAVIIEDMPRVLEDCHLQFEYAF